MGIHHSAYLFITHSDFGGAGVHIMLQIENPKTSNPLTRFKPLSTPKDRMPYKSFRRKTWPSSMPQRCILVNRGVSEACHFFSKEQLCQLQLGF